MTGQGKTFYTSEAGWAMGNYEDLVQAVAGGRVAFVLGAGATMASIRSSSLSWVDLIQRGIVRAVEVGAKGTSWADALGNSLEVGIADNDISMLISVATQVTDALGGAQSGTYTEWLRNEFEGLTALAPDLLDAIGRSGLPILTTNYDDVAARHLGRRSATWRDVGSIQRVLAGASTDVAHLHGVWSRADTVIFGDRSYATLLNDEGAQTLQRAVASTRTLILVGCGAGVGDPNIGGLLRWLREELAGSEVFHYFLCREGDEPASGLLPSVVRVVTYGAHHEDLPGFVSELIPESTALGTDVAASASFDVAAQAAEAVLEVIRGEALLAAHLEDVESAAVGRLILPPVLLPVTQQQYVESQSLRAEDRVRRCNLDDEVADGRHTLLVAEERAGLSTALRWLIHRAHERDAQVVPVYIDFKRLPPGHTPLIKLVKKELRAAGLSRDETQLPRLALALDNVREVPAAKFERAVADLVSGSLPLSTLVLGARQGLETELFGVLAEAIPDLSLRYIGRFNTTDINSLASLVRPTQARHLTEKLVEILNQEHLPRTPFTICLLIVALIQGQSVLGVTSETALLDAFIGLLLGGGDIRDDPRRSLDAYERSELLAELAVEFVERDRGSLTELEAVTILDEYFEKVDWRESAIDALNDLTHRRVLVSQDAQYRFAHASYLYLFAAKAAVANTSLRDKLFSAPLYYAEIVRHYAALNRADAEALGRVAELLNVTIDQESMASSGYFFGTSEAPDEVMSATSVDDMLLRLNLTAQLTGSQAHSEGDATHHLDLLDTMPEGEPDPFPADSIGDAPATYQIVSTLALVSTVLRDSEMVTDTELKTVVLARTLALWGKLVRLLEADHEFTEFVASLAARLAEDLGASPERAKRFIDAITRSAPALVAISGIDETLATRKLLRSLERLFSDESFVNEPFGAVMGAFLSFIIGGDGWAGRLLAVQEAHIRVNAVNTTMLDLAAAAYNLQQLTDADRAALERFIESQFVYKAGARTAGDRKEVAARVKQQLHRGRALHARERLPRGETVLQNPESLENLQSRELGAP